MPPDTIEQLAQTSESLSADFENIYNTEYSWEFDETNPQSLPHALRDFFKKAKSPVAELDALTLLGTLNDRIANLQSKKPVDAEFKIRKGRILFRQRYDILEIWVLPGMKRFSVIKSVEERRLAEQRKKRAEERVARKARENADRLREAQRLAALEREVHRSDLGFTPEEEKRLAGYKGWFLHGDPNIRNRTFESRLEDHEILLSDILNTKGPILSDYQESLLPHTDSRFFFIDIGPGIANKDINIKGGRGKPAITSQEMATKFPDMPVVVLDLPEEVDRFTGTTFDRNYVVDTDKRDEMLSHNNIHILSGNGLHSLLNQWNDPDTNPYPDRERPAIRQHDTIIVRTANAVDIYCEWEDVKPALARMAQDFKDHPVLLLFNKEIIIKEKGQTEWRVAGHVSDMGFNHYYRILARHGEDAYTLKHPFDSVKYAANE